MFFQSSGMSLTVLLQKTKTSARSSTSLCVTCSNSIHMVRPRLKISAASRARGYKSLQSGKTFHLGRPKARFSRYGPLHFSYTSFDSAESASPRSEEPILASLTSQEPSALGARVYSGLLCSQLIKTNSFRELTRKLAGLISMWKVRATKWV